MHTRLFNNCPFDSCQKVICDCMHVHIPTNQNKRRANIDTT
uniref:Uncharacterized protein n=2 Tax=unclassified Caudoviricetes TaxID=2788787 RepID=A0A8S5Q8K5_9CAUD|nr:MAG TPA: hypothetical protein [Siphoviridae sp. ctAvK3]DAE15153.1 MAG TPA: hypothetical protein [Siphoviridae sp. ctdVv30]